LGHRKGINGLPSQITATVLLVCTVFFLSTLIAAAQEAPPAPAAPPAAAATQGAAPGAESAAPAATAPAPAPPPPAFSTAPSHAMGAQGGPSSSPETVHIIVGHSLLVHTPGRIKRILTGNPDVIESVVTSPAELVVTAKKPGSSSLMLWDESGHNRSLDVDADLDVTPLRNSIEQSFPYASVDVQSSGDKVEVVGTVPSKDVADQVYKMAANFSKNVLNGLQIAAPPRQKQVMLKVRFAEADRTKISQFGFNLFSTGAANTIGTVSTQQFGPLAATTGNNTGLSDFSLSDLLNIFIFRPDINLGATLAALQQKNILQILSEPNLMAVSGEPAHFLAGGEFPYPVVQGGAAGTVPTVAIQFKPYGVKLEFIGTIGENNTIHLKVTPEVSTLDYTNTIVLSGFVLPSISTRRAETVVELKDGQTFGIAGLLDHRATVELSKIPGIGDIPILGELFKSRNANFSNTELLVLVTPTIVDPANGEVSTPQPKVTFPVEPINNGTFDKGLPYQPKNEGASK
jgi:pilus assembly protein CpaC